MNISACRYEMSVSHQNVAQESRCLAYGHGSYHGLLPYNNRRTPKHNTNIVRQTLKFMGTKVWNEIPTEVRNSHSNSIFKSHIKQHFFLQHLQYSMMHLAQPQ